MISKPKPYITVVKIPKVKIKKFDIAAATEPLELFSKAYPRLGKPTFMLNGGWYNTQNGDTVSNLIDEGVVKGKGCSNFGLIKNASGVCFGDINSNPIDFIGGVPALIKDGKSNIDGNYGEGYNNSRHPRSATGENSEFLFLVAVDGRQDDCPGMTLQELYEFMLSIGCTGAINLDGGGSTRLEHNGKAINKPTENRPSDSFICAWVDEEEQGMHRVYVSASTQDKNIGVGDYGTEQDRMHQMADRVQYWLKTQGKFEVFRNQKGWTLDQTVKDCNNLAVELFIDNHTNAPNSEGTEVYYHDGSTNGKKIADLLYAKIAPISPGKDREVHPDTVLYQSGLKVLRDTNPPAALIESIFHTNLKEVLHFLANMDLYAKAEAQAVCEYFGEKWIEPTTTTSAPTASNTKVLFSDMMVGGKPHYANDYVNSLVEKNIVKGYPDGTFHPAEYVSRADVCVIVAKALEKAGIKI